MSGSIRLPPGDNVPLSDRARRIVDSSAMRRLSGISQLGLVSTVYPGATHTRFEHSIGAYGLSLRWVDALRRRGVDLAPRWSDAFELAALLHDAGHWPFCHPIEDLDLPDLGRHEDRVAGLVRRGELRSAIDDDWRCDPDDVVRLLTKPSDRSTDEPAADVLTHCLSGPIDIDKMDYLRRDSLHAGVPYGNHFDADRLIDCLTLHPSGRSIAVDAKGRTAAEMMVFARYVMFSEVYWHKAVRSATAMLQRAVFLLQNRLDLPAMLSTDDAAWIATTRRMAGGSVAEPLVEGLFGPRRTLYKPVADFAASGDADVHASLARRPYWYLLAVAERLAAESSSRCGTAVHAADVLVDAPPPKLEVDINVDVIEGDRVRTLADVSPVAATLARHQFDREVKRVRVFVRPDLRDAVGGTDWAALIGEAIRDLDGSLV